jgi:formate/nitrite transporter FocA (FNT family)
MTNSRERWYRTLFWISAVYDMTLGIVFMFLYRPVFSALGIEDTLPEYTSFLSLIAAFLFVIGIAYALIARGDLERNRDLIAVGVLYKAAYFSVALWYLAAGVYPHIIFFAVFGLADLAFGIAMAECWWYLGRPVQNRDR